ncbi:MAG: ABC transporter ATP-binding protein [Bacteroidales bacterium]|nr:ABC transporter ATP-binding protein [Candidatus Colimorpha onthohippi]
MIYQLDNVSLGYDSSTVLQNISLQIEPNSFYAVMGPNGSGKSTLLRCLARLISPSAGSVSLNGKPIAGYSYKALAQQVSLVPQHVDIDVEFSAYQLVMMARHAYLRPLHDEGPEDLAIVEQSMRQTGVWDLRDKHLAQMSGGERARVLIARALAQQTPIILLDEPLANLDVAHQFDILQLLQQIHIQQHKTIMLVVHNLNLALTYCPQLILLYNHQVHYQGATCEGLTSQRIAQVFNIEANVTPHFIEMHPLRK